MNVAILSGKGGTGKTTVSTNLALALNANYVDCDVEEPNGFLFLKPVVQITEKVMLEYPAINEDKCIICGQCAAVCQFNALAKVSSGIMLFEKLCHGCGACGIVCENEALKFGEREIGSIEKGSTDNINCSRGILNIGEPMAVPVIRQLLQGLPQELNLIDCSPGTSCNAVSALRYSDSAILITEPTEFGLHDLKMAVELVRLFGIPFGIIINKHDGGENIIEKYCADEKITILGTIPYCKDIARAYSKGEILYYDIKHKNIFDNIAGKAREVFRWNW